MPESSTYGVSTGWGSLRWHCALDKLGKGVMAVQINGLGSSVPAGIAPVLNEILAALTNMDYRNRASLSWVRLKVWSAIKILQHEHEYHRRLALARERRAHRAELLKHKRRRLEIGASKGGSIC
jgi:hypothetical protein